MDYDKQFDNEWTPEELAQFRALDLERAPGVRTVFALAAASVVFAAGTVVGYAAGARRATVPAVAPTAAALAKVDSSSAAQRQQTRQVIWF